MRGIGRVVVTEDDELFLFAALDDLRRACIELNFDLIDDWKDEGSKEAEDKNVDLFCIQSV